MLFFWQKEIGAKAARKLLVKLTEGYLLSFSLLTSLTLCARHFIFLPLCFSRCFCNCFFCRISEKYDFAVLLKHLNCFLWLLEDFQTYLCFLCLFLFILIIFSTILYFYLFNSIELFLFSTPSPLLSPSLNRRRRRILLRLKTNLFLSLLKNWRRTFFSQKKEVCHRISTTTTKIFWKKNRIKFCVSFRSFTANSFLFWLLSQITAFDFVR